MDFDIHEDARTEGVALGAAPFLMCGWKARREEVRVTVPERAKPQRWRLVRMGDEREGAKEKAIEILRQRGFEVRRHVEFIGGVRQSPAFYAFW